MLTYILVDGFFLSRDFKLSLLPHSIVEAILAPFLLRLLLHHGANGRHQVGWVLPSRRGESAALRNVSSRVKLDFWWIVITNRNFRTAWNYSQLGYGRFFALGEVFFLRGNPRCCWARDRHIGAVLHRYSLILMILNLARDIAKEFSFLLKLNCLLEGLFLAGQVL